MILRVELKAYLSKFYPEGGETLIFDESTSVFEVMEAWQIPIDEVSIALFNDERIEGDTPITREGLLQLFPSVLGG